MRAVVTLGGGAVTRGRIKGTGKVLFTDLSPGYPGVLPLWKLRALFSCKRCAFSVHVMFHLGSMETVEILKLPCTSAMMTIISMAGSGSQLVIFSPSIPSLPSLSDPPPTPAHIHTHTSTGLTVTLYKDPPVTCNHNGPYLFPVLIRQDPDSRIVSCPS